LCDLNDLDSYFYFGRIQIRVKVTRIRNTDIQPYPYDIPLKECSLISNKSIKSIRMQIKISRALSVCLRDAFKLQTFPYFRRYARPDIHIARSESIVLMWVERANTRLRAQRTSVVWGILHPYKENLFYTNKQTKGYCLYLITLENSLFSINEYLVQCGKNLCELTAQVYQVSNDPGPQFNHE